MKRELVLIAILIFGIFLSGCTSQAHVPRFAVGDVINDKPGYDIGYRVLDVDERNGNYMIIISTKSVNFYTNKTEWHENPNRPITVWPIKDADSKMIKLN